MKSEGLECSRNAFLGPSEEISGGWGGVGILPCLFNPAHLGLGKAESSLSPLLCFFFLGGGVISVYIYLIIQMEFKTLQRKEFCSFPC